MKFLITGGNRGLGQELVARFHGDSISRADGYDITKHAREIAQKSLDYDVFVNNAQAGYAQTELLFEMAKRWSGTRKTIINISTGLTQSPVSLFEGLEMMQYRIQKIALEEAVKQLRHAKIGIRLVIVRPGVVKTQPNQTDGVDPDVWAQEMFDVLSRNNTWIDDVTIHPTRK